ncbi:MAG: helix-turn-helix domain-containing protein [Streptosporangiaceae bacterium]
MKADAGRKYRLYPGPGQAQTLNRWGHTCRALWNLALEQRRFAYAQRRVTLRAYDQCTHPSR